MNGFVLSDYFDGHPPARFGTPPVGRGPGDLDTYAVVGGGGGGSGGNQCFPSPNYIDATVTEAIHNIPIEPLSQPVFRPSLFPTVSTSWKQLQISKEETHIDEESKLREMKAQLKFQEVEFKDLVLVKRVSVSAFGETYYVRDDPPNSQDLNIYGILN